MSISKWDAQDKEQHYYVYKNSFVIKEACKLINITQPTWRTAIAKLKTEGYIQEYERYYIIEIPNTYAPLDINLIKFLLPFGGAIKNGGNIISVYSVIYRYWKYSEDNGQVCEITINQLKKLFQARREDSITFAYKLMINLFEFYGLIKIQRIGRQFSGQPYTGYVIQYVNLKLPNQVDLDESGPDNIEDILKALGVD